MSETATLASCFNCQLAQKQNSFLQSAECSAHNTDVWLPTAHICSRYQNEAHPDVAEEEGLEDGHLYIYHDFYVESTNDPTQPVIVHRVQPFMDFSDYAPLKLADKRDATKKSRDEKVQPEDAYIKPGIFKRIVWFFKKRFFS